MNTIDTLQSTSRAHEYLAHWAQLIAEYLGGLLHTAVTSEPVAAGNDPKNGGEGSKRGVWVRLSVDQVMEQAFFLSGPGALQLADLLADGTADQQEDRGSDNHKSIQTFFASLASRISMAEWLGLDAELKLSGSDRPEWEGAFETLLRFSNAQGPLLFLHSWINPEFVSALQSAKESDKSEREPHPGMNPYSSQAIREAPRDNRLELLMDVELEVVLRFGQREMLLHDVLTLTPGTVLELDQHVQDPVELLVGNKVIAWGEVVAVDGNYGLRITSLASRKERLESLRK